MGSRGAGSSLGFTDPITVWACCVHCELSRHFSENLWLFLLFSDQCTFPGSHWTV